MAPRSASLVEQPKNVFTAVVLADSFNQRFRPVSLDQPKVTLPLVNHAMLDYTLEWLAASGVKETWVFCCAHANAVCRHLADSRWITPEDTSYDTKAMLLDDASMKVRTIVSTNCMSIGEALRRVDQEDIIKTDFVLVSGDCVANMNLQRAVEQHRARRERNKSSIMTMVLRRTASALARERLAERPLVVVLDDADRVLGYEHINPALRKSNHVAVEAHVFSERDDVQIRTDLVDCNIYICAPEVLMLFSDNFDYQNMRKDFVSGVLSEEELGNQLHAYILQGREYAAWVHSVRSYDSVSTDVLQRWSYPLVPDCNSVPLREGRGAFQSFRGSMTREMLQNKRHTEVYQGSCVGDGTVIAPTASVSHSVVGRHCQIKDSAVLRNAYLMDGVVVEDGARVSYAILCSGVVVKAGGQVSRGCMLGQGTVVAARHTVPAYSRVSMHRHAGGDDSEDDLEYSASGSFDAAERIAARGAAASPSQGGFDTSAVGTQGKGFVWAVDEDIARDSIALPPLSFAPLLNDVELSTAGTAEPEAPSSRAASAAGDAEASTSSALGTVSHDAFQKEVQETLLRGMREGISIDNLVLEINSLKLAEVREFSHCSESIMRCLLDLCSPAPATVRAANAALFPSGPADVSTPTGRAELAKRFQGVLRRFTELLQRFVKDEDDEINLLLAFEEYCVEGDGRGEAFQAVVTQVFSLLYDAEVVSEEAFVSWSEEKQQADEAERRFLELAQPFLTWLEEAAEESDSDEDEEESD